MSYRSKHIKNKIHKIKPKKPLYKKAWFWILIASGILLLACLYFALFFQWIWVKDINVSGNQKVSTDALQSLAMQSATTGLVDVWPIKISSRSILLANTGKIKQEILSKFPIIEKLNIKRKLPQTIELGITERKPVGVYCQQDCFLIDQNGVIFEPAQANAGSLIITSVLKNENNYVGEPVIQKNVVEAIAKIQKSLTENFQIDLAEAMVTSPIRLDIRTKEGWKIYFNIDQNADIPSQITRLNLLLSDELSKDKRAGLKYVDMRTQDRAIICDNSLCGK